MISPNSLADLVEKEGKSILNQLTVKPASRPKRVLYMGKSLKRVIRSKGFVFLIYFFVRFYSRFLRIKVENEEQWLKYVENGGSVLLAVFHQQFFSLIRYFKNYERFEPVIMISRSSDGDIIAPVARHTGWKVARGSSSRGGKEAMYEMIAALSRNSVGANLVDGPKGPIGKVKPGTIRIAQKSGSVIVPCFVIAESAWYVNSWDRFMIPKPFSKVEIIFGDMIKADLIKTDNDFEKRRVFLEKEMAPFLYESPSKRL
ncbi:MAG: lysophospholipid acyltransferase family protein [Thermodesulfobacteriota bacterium]|nr:lysophospholipid acyltransferase family protein [Thermodesulfobacteriota bacterium]